jgi:hypothetical protein
VFPWNAYTIDLRVSFLFLFSCLCSMVDFLIEFEMSLMFK